MKRLNRYKTKKQTKKKKYSNKLKKLSKRISDISTSKIEFIVSDNIHVSVFNRYLRREGGKKYIPHELRIYVGTLINLSQDLSSLMLQMNKVVEYIIGFKCNEVLSFQTKCRSVIYLIKELRNEIIDLLPKLFDHFVMKLHQFTVDSDVEKIANVFELFGYMLKFEGEYMINNLKFWLNKYSDGLLSNKREYIRKFSAQNLSYLIKQLDRNQMSGFFQLLRSLLLSKIDDNFLFDGISYFLFEAMIINIKGSFNSRSPIIFSELINMIEWGYELKDKKLMKKTFVLLKNCCHLLVNHANNKNNITFVWNKLANITVNTFKQLNFSMDVRINHLLAIIEIFIVAKKLDEKHMKLILEGLFGNINIFWSNSFIFQKFLDMVQKLFSIQKFSFFLNLFLEFLMKNPPPTNQMIEFLFNVTDHCLDNKQVFDNEINSFNKINNLVFERRINLFERIFNYFCNNFEKNIKGVMSFFCKIIWNEGCDLLGRNFGLLVEKVFNEFRKMKNDISDMELYWSLIKIIRYFGSQNQQKEVGSMIKFVNNSSFVQVNKILSDIIGCITKDISVNQYFDDIIQIFLDYGSNVSLVLSVEEYFDKITRGDELLCNDNLHKLISSDRIRENVQSESRIIRYNTFAILSKFEQDIVIQNGQQVPCNFIELLSECEKKYTTWETTQEKSFIINKLCNALNHISISEYYQKVLIYYVVGGLYNRISILFKKMRELGNKVKTLNPQFFWDVIFKRLFSIQKRIFLSKGKKKFVKVINMKEIDNVLDFSEYDEVFKMKEISLNECLKNYFDDNNNDNSTGDVTYLDNIWDICFDNLKFYRTDDVVNLFDLYFSAYLNDDLIFNLNNNQKLSSRVENMIRIFESFKKNDIELQKGRIKDSIIRLISTKKRSVQLCCINVLKRMSEESWINLYYNLIKRIIANITSLDIVNIKVRIDNAQHMNNFVTLITKILCPHFHYDNIKNTDKVKRNWRNVIFNLFQFLFYNLPSNYLSYFLSNLFPSTDNSMTKFQIKWVIDLISEMFKLPNQHIIVNNEIFKEAFTILFWIIENRTSMMNNSIDLITYFSNRYSKCFSYDVTFFGRTFNLWDYYYKDVCERLQNNVGVDKLPEFFSIIFSWMKSESLVSIFLLNEFKEVPNQIINILSFDNVSGDVIDSVLEVLYSFLLNQDRLFDNTSIEKVRNLEENEEEELIGSVIIRKYVNYLITALYNLNDSKKSFTKGYIFKIVDNLTNLFDDESPSDIILSFYSTKNCSPKAIQIFKRYIPLSSNDVKMKYIKDFSYLFINEENQQFRLNLCEIFESMNQQDLSVTIEYIKVFNRPASNPLHSHNFEEINNQINKINLNNFFDDYRLLPICGNLLYFLKDEIKFGVNDNSLLALKKILEKIHRNSKYKQCRNMIISTIRKSIVQKKIIKFENKLCELYGYYVGLDKKKEISRLSDFFLFLSKEYSKNKKEAFNALHKVYNDNVTLSDNIMIDLVFPIIKNFVFLSEFSKEIRIIILQMSRNICWKYFKTFLNYFVNNENKKGNFYVDLIIEDFVARNNINENGKMNHYFIRDLLPVLIKKEINLSVIKLLKFCEKRLLGKHLRTIIRNVCGSIMKSNNDRNEMLNLKKMIFDIMGEIGSGYIGMIIKDMKDILKDGRHLITRNYIFLDLLKIISKEETPELKREFGLKTLFDVFSKEIEKPNPLKIEVVYKSYKFIGVCIDFSNDFEYLIDLIQKDMERISRIKVILRYERILDNLAVGLSKNTRIDPTAFLEILISKLKEGEIETNEFKDVYDANKFTKKVDNFIIANNRRKRTNQRVNINHSLIYFYFNTYYRLLVERKECEDGENIITLISYLLKFINERNSRLSFISLKSLIQLCKLNSNECIERKQVISDSLFNLLSNCGVDTSFESWEVLFSSILFFLEFSDSISGGIVLTTAQINYLLDILIIDIYNNSNNVNSYLLLQRFVEKVHKSPQIYDMNKKLRNTILIHNNENIKNLSKSIFISFMINYPMTEEVLLDHLNFFTKSLMKKSNHSSKVFITKTLISMIEKFPKKFLVQKVELFFVPLAYQYYYENAQNVKDHIESTMLILFQTLESNIESLINDIVINWIKGEKFKVIAIQVIPILMKVAKGQDSIEKSKFIIWNNIRKILLKENNSRNNNKKLISSSIVAINMLYTRNIIMAEQIMEIYNKLIKYLSNNYSIEIRTESLELVNSILSDKYLNNRINLKQLTELLIGNLSLPEQSLCGRISDLLTKSFISIVLISIEKNERRFVTELFNQISIVGLNHYNDKNIDIILKIYCSLADKLKENFTIFLNNIIPVLYFLIEEDDVGILIKNNANEVASFIQKQTNTLTFMNLYNEKRNEVNREFNRIDKENNQLIIKDPERFARMKEDEYDFKAVKRKRTIEEVNEVREDEPHLKKRKI